jgi:hypothetical protein
VAAGVSKMGGWKQVDRVLADVKFRDCEDHMVWTGKIQTDVIKKR